MIEQQDAADGTVHLLPPPIPPPKDRATWVTLCGLGYPERRWRDNYPPSKRTCSICQQQRFT